MSLERAYIEALQDELARAKTAQHKAEVRAELKRIGAAVQEEVETASATPVVENAAAPKRKAAVKK